MVHVLWTRLSKTWHGEYYVSTPLLVNVSIAVVTYLKASRSSGSVGFFMFLKEIS